MATVGGETVHLSVSFVFFFYKPMHANDGKAYHTAIGITFLKM